MNAVETIRFIIPVFCLATMFSMGLDLKLDDIIAPFRNWLALVIIVVTNNILVPLLGFLLISMPQLLKGTPLAGLAEQIVPLVGGQKIGFLLLFLAAGSLLGPVLVQLSGVPIPFAKGVMVVLVGVSALLVPVELGLLAQAGNILPNATTIVPAGSVFLAVLIYQLVPLAVGILINSQYSVIAVRLRPLIVQLTGLTLLITLAALTTSDLGLISVPGKIPTVSTLVATTTVLASTTTLTNDEILNAVEGQVQGNFPDGAELQAFIPKENKWVIFDTTKSYIIKTDSTTTPSVLSISPGNLPQITEGVVNRVAELNKGQFSQTLRNQMTDPPFKPLIDNLDNLVVVVIKTNTQWMLIDAATTYFVVAEDDKESKGAKLSIYQEQPQPSGVIVVTFLKSLAALPVVGPAIDFLTKLIVILVPYAMFGAVAALLLVIGYYCGVAVRSIVGMKDATIPRTLALSTGVRNVSMALIIATQHLLGKLSLTNTEDLGKSAIGIVLSFFLVSLIVAAIQATKWAGQPDTAPVMPPSQATPAAIAPEHGATSTP